jgi:2-polyprenyl-3-methyl-5-hydroxy-6-metoxy-1,4-benzoquinol methylase
LLLVALSKPTVKNPSQNSKADVYYNRDRPSIQALVKKGPNRILDLGCGSGAVGKRLLEQGKASELVGCELFEDAAAEAARSYHKVFTGDIEVLDLPYENYFDYVICGDILEHLKDPYSVVRRINGWLKQDGQFICSVPNVRYWPVLANLIFRGAWEYQAAGVMDRTHLRFFTRRSSFAMLHDAGFEVIQNRMLIFGRKYQLLNRVTFGLFDEFLGSQTVTLAKKQLGASAHAPLKPVPQSKQATPSAVAC